MYPLFTESPEFTKLKNKFPGNFQDYQRALQCLIYGNLPGISYHQELSEWQHVSNQSYKIVLKKNNIDILDMISADLKLTLKLIPHPFSQLCYPTGIQEIIIGDGILELPLISLTFIEFELHLESETIPPPVKIRATILNNSERKQKQNEIFVWRNYRIEAGLLHDIEKDEDYYARIQKPVTLTHILLAAEPIVSDAIEMLQKADKKKLLL